MEGVTPGETPHKDSRKPTIQERIITWSSLVSIAAVVFLAVFFLSSRSKEPGSLFLGENVPKAGSQGVAAFDRPDVGQEGTLTTEDDPSSVPICTTDASYDEWIDAGIANDKIGQTNLILRGLVIPVKTPVKILVLDHGLFSSQVRILEGENLGVKGWVAAEWVRK
jgi:hypothetical protein